MNLNVSNVSFGQKNPIYRIKNARDVNNKLVAPINDYVTDMVNQHHAELEGLARFLDRDVVLAQKGNTVLVNSGAITTAIELDKMKNGQELISKIRQNIIDNSAVSKTGLK